MKRVDGFLVLDEILGLKAIQDFENIEDWETFFNENANVTVVKSYYNRQIVLSFEYEGKKYFWKYEKSINPYNELVAAEIAEDLKIPHVSYDLACIGMVNGIISKDFKISDADYIDGEKILQGQYDSSPTTTHNNLDDIWYALEYRYNKEENMQEIVGNIMMKLVQVFIFDILTGQNDRHSSNWGVVEQDGKEPDLQILYDNAHILSLNYIPAISKVALQTYGNEKSYLEDDLLSFLCDSNIEFVKMIYDSLWVINEENLRSIFKRIETKIGNKMPQIDKEIYINKFAEQKDYIMEIIEKAKKGKSK